MGLGAASIYSIHARRPERRGDESGWSVPAGRRAAACSAAASRASVRISCGVRVAQLTNATCLQAAAGRRRLGVAQT
jgi:hypothetical protein